MKKIKLVNIVGTRPNFIKIAPFINELKKNDIFEEILIHTGQHFSSNMSDCFIEDLSIREPDYYLNIGKGSQFTQIGMIFEKLEIIFKEINPDIVIVVGDVNSTLAGALISARLNIKIAHIESGLRSFVFSMPEEQNRVIVDRLSNFLFTHSEDADKNLIDEGINKNRIFNVGNIMIDSLIQNRIKWGDSNILKSLNIKPKSYAVCTIHRAENVDDINNFRELIDILKMVSNYIKVIYPIHPRSLNRLNELGLDKLIYDIESLKLIEPLGYLDFMNLVENSSLVMTDSGGIQEETTFLGIPCLTLRNETERPITVKLGTNKIVGKDIDLIQNEIQNILNGNFKKGIIPLLWDGHTSQRIVDILKRKL